MNYEIKGPQYQDIELLSNKDIMFGILDNKVSHLRF